MQKIIGWPRGAPGGGGPHAMAQMPQWLIRPCVECR